MHLRLGDYGLGIMNFISPPKSSRLRNVYLELNVGRSDTPRVPRQDYGNSYTRQPRSR